MQRLNITNSSFNFPKIETRKFSSSGQGTLDVTKPNLERSPTKNTPRPKVELAECRRVSRIQNKPEGKDNLNGSPQARTVVNNRSNDTISPICWDTNRRMSTESSEITTNSSVKKIRKVANSLSPQDIKELCKEQLKGLKDGRKASKHLIERYVEEELIIDKAEDDQKAIKDAWNNKMNISKCEDIISAVKPDVIRPGLDTCSYDVSPPDRQVPTELKARPQSILEGDSSQSLSLSKVLKLASSIYSINGTPGNNRYFPSPVKDNPMETALLNSNGKDCKPMKRAGAEYGVSIDWSTMKGKLTPNSDTYSKMELGSNQDYGTDTNERSVDFLKPIPALSNTRKVSMELELENCKKLSASKQVSRRRTKNAKMCRKWWKGRCLYGNRCWFAHNANGRQTDRESCYRLDRKTGGRTQLKSKNPNSHARIYRSPRERERDKCPHLLTADEVMKLKKKGLWKLGHELKLVWPVNTKREVLCKLIIAQLSNTEKLDSNMQIVPTLAKKTLMRNTDTRIKTSTNSSHGTVVSNKDNAKNKFHKGSLRSGTAIVSEDDLSGSNLVPPILKKKKKRRHHWNTPRRSPKVRPNMRKKSHEGKQSKNMISDWRKDNGGIDLARVKNLNIDQLWKLAEELELSIPKGISKRRLQRQIISAAIFNSSDRKHRSQSARDLSDKSSSSLVDVKSHWSPPSSGLNFRLPDKYPEKGVRIMKFKEAYPDDKSWMIAKSHLQFGVGDRKVGAYSSRKNEAPGDDITRSKTSPSIIPECKVKKKRQLRNTLQSSADDRPNMKKKRHKEKYSSNMFTWLRKQDGSIDHRRILRLNLKELRKLAEDLKLKMPKDFKKHQIRDQIISLLISSSSEWKLWSKATKKLRDNDLSETTDVKTQCSPVNTPHDLALPDQYPVKGVRAAKTRDAYPEDKCALGVKKNAGLGKSCPSGLKRAGEYLDNSIPTGDWAVSLSDESLNSYHKTGEVRGRNRIVNNWRLNRTAKGKPKLNPTLISPARRNGQSNDIRLMQKPADRDVVPHNLLKVC